MEEHFAKIKGIEEPEGISDAYGVNLKRLVARELDMDRERQGQESRLIELAIATQARINEISMQSLQAFTNSMDERQKDSRNAGLRKEHSTEERAKELEEVFNKTVQASSGVNSQMVGLNTAIAEAVSGAVSGVIQELIASGKLKAGGL